MLSPFTAEIPSTLKGYFFSGIIVTVKDKDRAFVAGPFKKILSGLTLANLSTTPNTVR